MNNEFQEMMRVVRLDVLVSTLAALETAADDAMSYGPSESDADYLAAIAEARAELEATKPQSQRHRPMTCPIQATGEGGLRATDLFAVVVESSDDGGRSWEIHGIAWTTGKAAMLAREIPWKWRLRKVALSDAGLIGWEETKSELAMMEKMESIFSANIQDEGQPEDRS